MMNGTQVSSACAIGVFGNQVGTEILCTNEFEKEATNSKVARKLFKSPAFYGRLSSLSTGSGGSI